MKKWVVLALIACVALAARAGEGEAKKKGAVDAQQGKEVSKKQFVAQQRKMAEKKGVEFDAAKAEKKFAKLDKNSDGKLTGAEVPQPAGEAKKGKDAPKEKPIAPEKKMTEKHGAEAPQQADEVKKKSKGGAERDKEVSKEQFIARQKKMAEKKGVEFDAAEAAEKFAKMDKNADGKLTGAEVPRKGKAKGEKAE